MGAIMYNNKSLQRKKPEELGISSEALLAFIDALGEKKLELHSFMLLRHGCVAAEGWWSPYEPDRPHMLFSLSKSFTSSAIGLCVHEGRLSVDDYVLSFFPDMLPENPDINLKNMRIRHLLSMSTGHAEDTAGHMTERKNGNWVKGFLDLKIDYQPGTHFVYNSGATYMLSAIVTKVTGQKLVEYLIPRLFEKLDIGNASWEVCPMGINTGGWGLSIKTEDIAKFGQMYLQKGIWNSERILQEKWVDEATSFHIKNGEDKNSDWAQGYGYQFWRCRHNAYRGDGAFGQYCIVMPEQDAVIAITSGLSDMQAVLNLIWEHLLPAMKDMPLPRNEESEATLDQRLLALKYLPEMIQSSSPRLAGITGKRYIFEENESKITAIYFNFNDNGCEIEIFVQGEKRFIRCGHSQWILGETSLTGKLLPVAASCTWKDENTLIVTFRFYETPFYQTEICTFTEDDLIIKSNINVSFGSTELPILRGKMLSA